LGIGGVLISSMFRGVLPIVVLALTWGIVGGIVGIVQRLILRQAGLTITRWAGWTAMGWAIGAIMFGLGIGTRYYWLQEAVLGFTIGAMQWLPLRSMSIEQAGG
jgi:hypothetical protein